MNDGNKTGFLNRAKDFFEKKKEKPVLNRKQKRMLKKRNGGAGGDAKTRVHFWWIDKKNALHISKRKIKHFGTFSPIKKISRGSHA